ncbi:hypothetical protein ABPG72_007434 [Tetrahymena utriculariae]
MKRSIFILIISISCIFAQNIPFCETHFDVLDHKNTTTRICIECLYGLYVSDSYSEQTAENFALTQSQASTEYLLFDDQCSLFSEDNSKCLLPKFGYTYVIPEKTYILSDQTMCSIYNSSTKTCEEYYYRFLPVQGSNYSVFMGDFENYDKIKQGSTTTQIVCIKGFKFTQFDNMIGCQEESQQDLFCTKTDEFMRCVECAEGQAINAHTGKCIWVLVKAFLIQLIEYPQKKFAKCLQCQKRYSMETKQKFNKYPNCSLINKNLPYNCLAGKTIEENNDKRGFCKSTFTPMVKQCEQFSYKGNYLKQQNGEYYLVPPKVLSDIYRHASPNIMQDILETNQITEYQMNYFYAKQQIQLLFDNKLSYDNNGVYYIPSFEQPKGLTKVEGCSQYSLFEDLCTRSENGLNLFLKQKEKRIYCSTKQIQSGFLIYDKTIHTCLKNFDFLSNYQKENCPFSSCDNQQKQCLQCKDGYLMDQGGTCIKQNSLYYIWKEEYKNHKNVLSAAQVTQDGKDDCIENQSDCSKIETLKCFYSQKLIYCFYSIGEENVCIQCKEKYSVVNGVCEHNQKSKQDKRTDQNCLSCPFNNLSYCYSCKEGFVLSNGQCSKNKIECQKGEFLPHGKGQTCQKCPIYCSQCISENVCIICKDPSNSTSNQCRCKLNELLHQNICVEKCPFGWRKSQKQQNSCEKICSQNEIFMIDKENYVFKCVNLNETENHELFCKNLVEDLQQLKIGIQNSDSEHFDLTFTFNKETKNCFTFKLINIFFVEFKLVEVDLSNQHEFQMVSNIKKKDLIPQQIDGESDYGIILLKIYQDQVLIQAIKVKITINTFLIMSNEFSIDVEPVEKICHNCEIHITMQVQSSISVSCKISQDCSSSQLSVQTREEIEITQVKTDSKYQNSTIEPHELIFIHDNLNNGDKIKILDYPHQIDQSQLGKITYKFKAQDQINNTTVRMASKVKKLNKNRILEGDTTIFSKKFKQLIQNFQILIKEKDTSRTDLDTYDQNNQNKNGSNNTNSSSSKLITIIIIIILESIVGIAITGLIVVKVLLKRSRKQKYNFSGIEIETRIHSSTGSSHINKEKFEIFQDQVEINLNN